MEAYYIGHSAFYVEGVVFDPWIEGNPKAVPREMSPSHAFVSHDHRDHGLEDAICLSKEKGSVVVGMYELVQHAMANGADGEGANIGGWFDARGVSVFLTPAFHSSTLGDPCGFVVKLGGKTIYHAGDTSVFSEMAELSRFSIDLAFLPIGGRFTMDVDEAARAVELLKPKVAIPMHYNTFPQIEANPLEFKDKASCEVLVMEPGETVQL